jgi:hypothetical protein
MDKMGDKEIIFPDEPFMFWYGDKREFYLPYPYSIFVTLNSIGVELAISNDTNYSFGFEGFGIKENALL